MDLNAIPYVPARDQWPRRTSDPHIWIVLHTIQSGETRMTAENCARYFQDPRNADGSPRIASTQFVCDDDSTIRCAGWEMRVAGAVGANDEAWHIEQAGVAEQTAEQWRDDYSTRMLTTQVAPLVAALSKRDGIPLRFVDAAGLRRREKGVTTHHECWKAFGGDVRTDPGEFYPMADVLGMAQRINDGDDDVMSPEQFKQFLAQNAAEHEKTRVYLAGKHEEGRKWILSEVGKLHETTRTWLRDRIKGVPEG